MLGWFQRELAFVGAGDVFTLYVVRVDFTVSQQTN